VGSGSSTAPHLTRRSSPCQPATPSPTSVVSTPSLPRWWTPAAVVTATAILLSVGLAGHASAGRWVVLAVPFDFIHLAGVAIWVGGLAVLVTGLLVRRAGSAVIPHQAIVVFSQLAAVDHRNRWVGWFRGVATSWFTGQPHHHGLRSVGSHQDRVVLRHPHPGRLQPGLHARCARPSPVPTKLAATCSGGGPRQHAGATPAG